MVVEAKISSSLSHWLETSHAHAQRSHQLKQDEGYRLLGRIERLVLEYEIDLHAHDCDEETSGPILANGNYSTQLCRPCMAVARL